MGNSRQQTFKLKISKKRLGKFRPHEFLIPSYVTWDKLVQVKSNFLILLINTQTFYFFKRIFVSSNGKWRMQEKEKKLQFVLRQGILDRFNPRVQRYVIS